MKQRDNIIFRKQGLISQIIQNSKSEIQYSMLLEGVLKGITDVIIVYNCDHTVLFLNQAGYEFYHKTPEQIKGMKCFEVKGWKEKCSICYGEEAISTKQIIRFEKYYPEYDKFMEYCCNPVLDDSGEVIFLVEQLRDITEKKTLENSLKESEERYRKIVDLSPDAIIITVHNKIVLANKEALKLRDGIIGENVCNFAPGFEEILNKRVSQIIEKKQKKTIFDYKVQIEGNREIFIEASSGYLTYNGEPAVISIMRDISERKRELNRIASIQNQLLPKKFPILEKADMEIIYTPAKTVSGDFIVLHKVNEDMVVGIISDVSGKGISAALNISALNVLFNETVLVTHDPSELINILNKKIVNYCGESYIAACCFSLDFKNNIANVVGAGINQFIYQRNNAVLRTVKGPFLGMFEKSVFERIKINFKPGDKFYFLTDGFEHIFNDDEIMKEFFGAFPIEEVKKALNDYVNDMLSNIEGIKDDCTMLALAMK